MGLTLRFPFQEEGKGEVLVTLEPEGKAGVRYDLARALREAKPIVRETLPQGLSGVSGRECYNDLRGNVVINSSPWMVSLNGEGGVNWFVSNKWPNVGGSHSAPPLTRGVLQGVLFALGVAPLDAEGDVMALIGNMGPVFLMTTDGLYVDRLFKDGRVYGTLDYQNLRGEPFGGTFQYDAATKSYVMQAGHGGYRMYRIEGLETVRRFAGEVEVTEAFLREAMAQEAREEAREGEAKASEVHRVGKVDANARRLPLVAEWQRGEGRCRVMGAYDEEQLVLRWEVEDASPWKNEGAEWTHLFKTGDSVDVQLGLPGGAETVRLLVAPYAGGSVAVLYRFLDGKGARVEGRNPVEFASPWRSFWVDDVRRLEGVKPRVEKRAGGYVVTVAVPWRELGVTAESLAGVRRGDFGVIFGDAAGRVNVSRSYWANQATGLVSDVPGEVEPRPKEWGRVDFVTGEETLKAEFVGVVGNSGTEEKPVQMGPYEVGGQSQAGPYFDEATGLLYETAGSQRLNVLGLDGVVRRSYRIPAGKFATRGESLVRVGESLYFRRNERLWRVGVSEADGAEAERAACELEGIRMLSSSARDGEIALWLKDQTLWLWNAETGKARKLGALELRLESLDWNRSGTLFAFTQDTVYKLEEGSIVTQDGFPKKVIGRGVPLARGCFTGGAYYAVSHSGSVLRLNEETLEPDPGVVFGGAGGHTLMAVFIDRDIDNGSGVVHVGEDLFAVGGASGVVTLLRWNAREEKLERVRRLGSIPEVPTLELSREGIIHAGRVGFAWNADAQAPCVTSWNVGARVSARFGEDRCLRLGKNAYGAVEAGPLEAVMRRPYIHKREMDDFSSAVGVAIREDREAYVLWPTGIVKRYRFSCGVAQLMFEAAGEVSLRLSEPCEMFSGFVHVDDEAFLLIAGGRIVQVEPRGEDLVEVGRWDETFSQDIRMACDGEHVAIAEPSENRVRVFTRAGKEVGRVAVSSPGAVAIRGRNLVVFELDPQRVAKYRLHRMMKEQGVER